ncbi:hypothetical protein ABWI01_11175 [Oceanicaulis alexandrii]|uniref:hypothetical protein n=1 Tax=Oceanicaulis alexandrii TaxID=153233 RepID=UPI0035CF5A3D
MILKTASALIGSLAATGAAMAQSQDLSACDESAYTPPFSTVMIMAICLEPTPDGVVPTPMPGMMNFMPNSSLPGSGQIQTSLPAHSGCDSAGESYMGSWRTMPETCQVTIDFTNGNSSVYFTETELYGEMGFSIFSLGSDEETGPWGRVLNFENVSSVQSFE